MSSQTTTRAQARAEQQAKQIREAVERYGVSEDREGWAGAAGAMEADGWTVRFASEQPPLRLEGSMPTGDKFFLRDGRAEVVLGVGGDDPVNKPEWLTAIPMRDASYLPADDAAEVFTAMLQRWLDRGA